MVRPLYYAYVFPHTNIGIELYGSAFKTNIAKIHVVKNLLLRPLPKRNRRVSATTLHRERNILKVHDIFTLNILTFVYRQDMNQLPDLFHQFYKLSSEIMMRRSIQEANLYTPRSKNRIGENSLKLTGTRQWN